MNNGLYDNLPAKVRVRDMTLRDGLQSIPPVLPTALKLEIYDGLVAAGVSELQITSFVNPARVPQLADAEALWALVAKRPERKSVLVGNLRGFERAIAAGASEVEAVVSLSETYNKNNTRRTTRESLDEIKVMAAQNKGNCKLTVALANCFHCVSEGWMSPDKVMDALAELSGAGITEISICDTTGHAAPDKVYRLSSKAMAQFPKTIFGIHLHDTRGRGLANAIAALQAGIRWFDATLAGLGGSPFAAGMGGNLSLETFVEAMAVMGVNTGIDAASAFDLGNRLRLSVNQLAAETSA
jgi:hydroxymethylglutaryl-CoA lyase